MTHYIIIRADLPIGFQAAQIVHAAGESIKEPLPPNTHAVVLAVKDETHLLEIARRLQLSGIAHISVIEIDEPYTNQHTAIGIVPIRNRAAVRPILSSLPLLGQHKFTPCREETPVV